MTADSFDVAGTASAGSGPKPRTIRVYAASRSEVAEAFRAYELREKWRDMLIMQCSFQAPLVAADFFEFTGYDYDEYRAHFEWRDAE